VPPSLAATGSGYAWVRCAPYLRYTTVPLLRRATPIPHALGRVLNFFGSSQKSDKVHEITLNHRMLFASHLAKQIGGGDCPYRNSNGANLFDVPQAKFGF
jgi:hypothetical protein